MAKMHKPGTYPAKIVDFGLLKGKNGLPQCAVMFEYQLPEGGTDRITWFGSFNGGAKAITVEALVRMGFTGKNGSELSKGNGSGVLDQNKQFEIVVGDDTYNGVTKSKVKFVNLPGGSGFREHMAEGEAGVLMGGLSLEADFMEARSHVGKPAVQTPSHPSPLMEQQQAEDDLPF